MANFQEIFREVDAEARGAKTPHDVVRNKYLEQLAEKTERNVLAYYSGWLQKDDYRLDGQVSINDEDKNGFMACFHGQDFTKGLDLILHTPGGQVAATCSAAKYVGRNNDCLVRI